MKLSQIYKANQCSDLNDVEMAIEQTRECIKIRQFEKKETAALLNPILMKILNLTLKKKWFDMILSGEKKEEYREIKSYWWNRLEYPLSDMNIKYDVVKFKNGYSKNAPTIIIECLGVKRGNAKPEWSDNWEGKVFVIELGNIIETTNCTVGSN